MFFVHRLVFRALSYQQLFILTSPQAWQIIDDVMVSYLFVVANGVFMTCIILIKYMYIVNISAPFRFLLKCLKNVRKSDHQAWKNISKFIKTIDVTFIVKWLNKDGIL